MGRITGEVELIEHGSVATPPRILTAAPLSQIATLKLRVRDVSNRQLQIVFRGDIPGHVDVGDRVRITGVISGGLFRADTIFNETTSSWVTERECFIATASAGRESAEVRALRRLRDEVLCRTFAGSSFVNAYEAVSPPLARLLARSSLLRRATHRFLVIPASIVGWLVTECWRDPSESRRYGRAAVHLHEHLDNTRRSYR